LVFQISAFFTALFSYLIFFLPVILGKMNDSIFLLSGIMTFIITGIFIYIVSWFAPLRILKSIPMLALSIGTIFTVVNVLYFTNIIPPIPLSLKDMGIYRSVVKIDDNLYTTSGEKHSWFENFIGSYEIRMLPGQPLYAWSSIFAPSNLTVDVIHVWQYKDPSGVWVTASRMDLKIVGGRDNGFRTYSVKENVFPGVWRVNVETPRGQLLGRINFKLEPSDGNETLETLVK